MRAKGRELYGKPVLIVFKEKFRIRVFDDIPILPYFDPLTVICIISSFLVCKSS